jgi:hypothetical protein
VINDTYKGINTLFIALFADLEIMQILNAITRLNQSIIGTDIFFIILYQNNQKQSVYTITLQIAKNTIFLDLE